LLRFNDADHCPWAWEPHRRPCCCGACVRTAGLGFR